MDLEDRGNSDQFPISLETDPVDVDSAQIQLGSGTSATLTRKIERRRCPPFAFSKDVVVLMEVRNAALRIS